MRCLQFYFLSQQIFCYMGIVVYTLYTFILFNGNTSPIVQCVIFPFSEAPGHILVSYYSSKGIINHLLWLLAYHRLISFIIPILNSKKFRINIGSLPTKRCTIILNKETGKSKLSSPARTALSGISYCIVGMTVLWLNQHFPLQRKANSFCKGLFPLHHLKKSHTSENKGKTHQKSKFNQNLRPWCWALYSLCYT